VGIEDEQLVFDYLSKVGDLAHGTSMSAAQRAGLVSRLRDEIGRQRAAPGGAGSRTSVPRILGRMGRPEDVVAAEAATAPAAPAVPAAAPKPRESRESRESRDEPRAGRRAAPAPRKAAREAVPPGSPPPESPEVPLAEPASADDRFWPDGQVGRFFGGIEIPALLRPPGPTADERPGTGTETETGESPHEEEPGEEEPGKGDPGEGDPGEPPPRRPGAGAGRARRSWARSALAGKRVGGPVELLGVLLLLAGTVLGTLYVLAAGWLLAYWSPRLSRREGQWAAIGMPGVVGGGYLLWLLGRTAGYWGEPLADGEAGDAFADHWPWLIRGAALASAAFLLWRARRHRRGDG
jgi:hypothetical protein